MQIYADYSNKLNSNCYTADRGGHQVLVLVCHNTEGKGESNFGQTRAEAQQHSDFEAEYLANNPAQVSIHYVVGEEECDAPIYRIVPEAYTAYHCGGEPGFPSKWVNPDDSKEYGGYGLNQVAIGIELVGQHNETVGPKQLASLQALMQDLVSRYPILKKQGHIVAHKELEGDREDGVNWYKQAIEWVAGVNPVAPTPVITPISYQVTVPQFEATVRKGPGRQYDIVTSLKPDPTKQYHVDGESHGELISSDDVWVHLPDVGGFATRTVVQVIH